MRLLTQVFHGVGVSIDEKFGATRLQKEAQLMITASSEFNRSINYLGILSALCLEPWFELLPADSQEQLSAFCASSGLIVPPLEPTLQQLPPQEGPAGSPSETVFHSSGSSPVPALDHLSTFKKVDNCTTFMGVAPLRVVLFANDGGNPRQEGMLYSARDFPSLLTDATKILNLNSAARRVFTVDGVEA